LYTSLEADGAIAETVFHQRRGQPVLPSKPSKRLYPLDVTLSDVLDLGSLDDLGQLGVDQAQFGRMAYAERASEYPSLQELAEVAHFLAFKAMLVPSARWDCRNLVIFTERCAPGDIERASAGKILDLSTWYQRNGSQMK
jgi:hypothetical protein